MTQRTWLKLCKIGLFVLRCLSASLAHRYAFSHTEFIDGQDGSMCRFLLAFCDSTIPVDFLLELGTFPIFYRRAQMVNADGYTSVSTDDYDTDDAEAMVQKGMVILGTKIKQNA